MARLQVWEIKQRALVDMAAERGAYIDQSQSFNVHMEGATASKLTSLHFHARAPPRPAPPRLSAQKRALRLRNKPSRATPNRAEVGI